MDGAAAVDFPFYTVVKAGEVFVHLFSIIQKGCGEAKEWMVAIDFFPFIRFL
jgi:hypothetical protein